MSKWPSKSNHSTPPSHPPKPCFGSRHFTAAFTIPTHHNAKSDDYDIKNKNKILTLVLHLTEWFHISTPREILLDATLQSA